MQDTHFIAGDWGTSNLTLYLFGDRPDADPTILDARSGPGVNAIHGRFEDVFFELAGDWMAGNKQMPIMISGMAGSNIGWKEAPYLDCPIRLNDIADRRTTFSARGMSISIIPGLKTENPLGAADLMRGEELQLLGWLHANKIDDDEPRLIALPGTHNKWVIVRDGKVDTFLTSPTGELFALIEKHSILVDDTKSGPFNVDAFNQGVKAVHALGDANLLHALFTTRSDQVLKKLPEEDAASYLSGLLIGSDVAGAVALFRSRCPTLKTVAIIGESQLSDCYQIAVEAEGLQVDTNDSVSVAVAGYSAVYKRWFEKEIA